MGSDKIKKLMTSIPYFEIICSESSFIVRDHSDETANKEISVFGSDIDKVLDEFTRINDILKPYNDIYFTGYCSGCDGIVVESIAECIADSEQKCINCGKNRKTLSNKNNNFVIHKEFN